MLGLPNEFGILLLILCLVLTLAPYFSGYDFGVIRIPTFGVRIKRRLKFIGPISLLLVFALHFPYKMIWEPRNDASAIVAADMYTLHMYNVDDIAELAINGRAHYKAKWGYQGYEPIWFPYAEYGPDVANSKPGDSQVINITSDLQTGDNILDFTLWDSGIAPGAASLSISVRKNGKELIGEQFSLPHYTSRRHPGVVYQKEFHIQD